MYQLRGALVGYQLGVGAAYDVQQVSSSGTSYTDRVIVMAAIVNGFGIAVITEGQLLQPVVSSSAFWNGHPSPANLNLAYGADEAVNSTRFPRRSATADHFRLRSNVPAQCATHHMT